MREKRNRSNMVSNSHLTKSSSSIIIVQQNETEPGEPSAFQLTSEESKYVTISLCSLSSLSLPPTLYLTLSLSLSLWQSYMLMKTVFELARRERRS